MGAGARHLPAGADLATYGKRLVEQALEQTRAMTVGRVVSFSGGGHPTCSVQPLIPRWIDDREAIEDPVLDDVPVLYPGTRGLRFDFPLTDGDLVLVLFCDRPLDDVAELLQTDQALDPQPVPAQSPRMHDLTDAVAVPFASYGQAGQVDLLALLDSLLSTLETATVVDPVSGALPFSPAVITALTALRTQLAPLL